MNNATTIILILAGLLAAALVVVVLRKKRRRATQDAAAPMTDLAGESALAHEDKKPVQYVARPERTVAVGYYIENEKRRFQLLDKPRQAVVKADTLAIAKQDCPIWAFAPPGVGKTTALIIPAILDWRGPVLSTSIKYDVASAVHRGRALLGRVSIFDPGEELLKNPDDELTPLRGRWTPLTGCDRITEALEVAAALVAGGSAAGSGDQAAFWQQQAASVIGVLMWLTRQKPGTSLDDVNQLVSSLGHTTDCEDANGETVQKLGWETIEDDLNLKVTRCKELISKFAGQPDKSLKVEQAHARLSEVSAALNEWSPLVGVAKSAPQTIGGVLAQVNTALAGIRQSAELRSTKWDEEGLIDLGAFVTSSDTLFVVSPVRASKYAPILTAFTQAVIDKAYEVADQQPGEKRLPTELLCALDEVPTISPLPRLPDYAATGRSYGIQLLCIAQNVSQCKDRWNEHKANALLGNSSGAYICLPQGLDLATVEHFSKLFGEHRLAERSTSTSTNKGSSWGAGQHVTRTEGVSESVTLSYTWRSVATPAKLQNMHPDELAAIVGGVPIQLVQRRWFEDEDLAAFAAGSQEAFERLEHKYRAAKLR